MTKGALFLTLAGVIAKVIGAIYRIPLTNILGGSGIGMYQLVFPVFALLLTVTSGGMATVISKIVSEKKVIGDADGIKHTLKSGILLSSIFALISGVVLCGVAAPLAAFQGVAELKYCYYIIAPTLIFVSIEACFRGYFQGKMNLKPTAFLQITEQLAKMIIGLTLAYILIPYGLVYAVMGAIFGVAVSEYICMTLLIVLYFRDREDKGKNFLKNLRKKKEKKPQNNGIFVRDKVIVKGLENTCNSGISSENRNTCKQKNCKKSLKNFNTELKEKNKNLRKELSVMLKASMPMTVCAMILPLSQFIDSILIVNLLELYGVNHNAAVADYGLLTAPIASLINLPVMLTLSLAVVIVPLISGYMAERNIVNIKQKSEIIIKLNYLISVPCFVGVFTLARPIMTALYPAFSVNELNVAVVLTMLCAINIVLLASLQVYNSLMQALGRVKSVIWILVVAVIVKIILDFILIKYLGILGAGIALVIGYTVATVANGLMYRKLLGNNLNIVKSVSKIIVISGIIGIIALIFRRIISNPYTVIAVVVVIAVVIYTLLVLLSNVFSKEELLTLPYGRKLAKVSEAFVKWRTDDDFTDEQDD